MPSASTSTTTPTTGPPPSTSSSASQLEKIIEQTLDPFKQAITVLEHKVRNLEKRKGKLDSYKQEQEQGKELNGDQLTAVAKYNEVAQQLDLAREMMKQLAQIQTETYRSLKKQQKKDQAERALVECEKYKQMLTLQSCLRQMSNPRVRDDFQTGKDCALTLKESDFAVIDELQQVVSLELNHPDFQAQLQVCAEQLFSLCEEKSTMLTGQTTFKDAKTLLLNIAASDYFDPTKVVEVAPEPEPVEPIIVESSAPTSVIEILSAQSLTTQESTYQFIQESQIDIESPHMDPAVVAVSSYAPPQPHSQRNEANSNLFNTSSSSGLNPTGRSQNHPGDQIDDMNLNHLSIKEPEEIDEWNTQIVHPPSGSGAYNNANNSASQETEVIDEGEPQDTYDRSGRGGFRRGGVQSRPRGGGGPMNGYRGPRMPSRGGAGGYQNGRGNFQGQGFREGYFPRDRYERDDFGRDERVFEREREEQFDRNERYERAGFERGERFDRGERFGEQHYDRGDNDMGEFRAPRPGTRGSGPGTSGGGAGAGPGYGNRGGNPYGGQGQQGQRGMARPVSGMVRGGPRPFRGSLPNHGPNQGSNVDVY